MSNLDDLPDEVILQLSRAELGPEVIRLRNMLKDSQRANKSKRKKVQLLRQAVRNKHAQFKSLLARL